MLLKCSGLHAHYTDSDNELLLVTTGLASWRLLAARAEGFGESLETESCWGLSFVTIHHERGMPCNWGSSGPNEYVPGSCTHRPSLSVMDCAVELFRGDAWGQPCVLTQR